jgi:hypothetical protein
MNVSMEKSHLKIEARLGASLAWAGFLIQVTEAPMLDP